MLDCHICDIPGKKSVCRMSLDWAILTKLSGKYVRMLKRTAQFQTGIDHCHFKTLFHTWRAWTF